MRSRDIVSLGLWQRFYLTLRWYGDARFGVRSLGGRRYALDLGCPAIIVEDYGS